MTSMQGVHYLTLESKCVDLNASFVCSLGMLAILDFDDCIVSLLCLECQGIMEHLKIILFKIGKSCMHAFLLFY